MSITTIALTMINASALFHVTVKEKRQKGWADYFSHLQQNFLFHSFTFANFLVQNGNFNYVILVPTDKSHLKLYGGTRTRTKTPPTTDKKKKRVQTTHIIQAVSISLPLYPFPSLPLSLSHS